MIGIDKIKLYLRIDDDAFDSELLNLEKTAILYWEKQTNVLLTQREKTYNKPKRIYDFPIADTSALNERSLYFTPIDYCVPSLNLLVGYVDFEDVPQDIVTCLLMLIKYWFEATEDEKLMNKVPFESQTIINSYRRYFL
jgi:hypothetical protein